MMDYGKMIKKMEGEDIHIIQLEKYMMEIGIMEKKMDKVFLDMHMMIYMMDNG